MAAGRAAITNIPRKAGRPDEAAAGKERHQPRNAQRHSAEWEVFMIICKYLKPKSYSPHSEE